MRLLSFDTSARLIEVCLLEDGQVTAQCSLTGEAPGRQETASLLLPTIDNLLKEHNWQKKSIDAVVAGVGPGSFTGVRVAVVTARAMGQGLELPLVPITTLEGAVLELPGSRLMIRNAGSGSFFLGAFAESSAADPCQEFFAPLLVPGAELPAKLSELPSFKAYCAPDCLAPLLALGLDEVSEIPQHNLATNNAKLAWQRISREGRTTRQELLKRFPWNTTLPLYIRGPSITLKKKGILK